MRGYKAVDGVSDEAEEYRSRLEGVPVVAQWDRVAGLRELFAREGDVDVVVLDDGFQHRRIARELDIVLVDATRDPFEDRLLPAGWLREPVASLGRAQVVVITHAECVDGERVQAMAGRVREASPDAAIVVARHTWAGFVDEHGREASAQGRALAVCAIGNPEPFLLQARQHVEVAREIVLRDHDPYEQATIDRIRREASGLDLILTTGKDWSKLSRAGGWACPVVRPVLKMSFDRGWEELRGRVLGAAEQAASIA
jgi:tetraacyldisaccharide 4'-kinase